METIIQDTAILFFLGICGWKLFSVLNFPAAPILGTLTVIGILRIIEYPLPTPPDYIFLIVQVMLGCSAGTKITKESVGELKTMIVPASIIITWALSMVLLLSVILRCTTSLDLNTSLLSSSLGGLSGMTILALASGADVTVVVIMQTFRVVATNLIFPIIVKKWLKVGKEETEGYSPAEGDSEIQTLHFLSWLNGPLVQGKQFLEKALDSIRRSPRKTLGYTGHLLLTITLAAVGGFLFTRLSIPAGAMLGAMFSVALASLSGVPVKPIPEGVFNFMLVGLGIMVSSNILPETLEILKAGGLFIPILLVTLIAFMTSLGVALFIHKVVGWDYPTCFLAAAPGGFAVMTTLAIKYGQNPLHVSILQLCRLIVLRIVMPLIFVFLI